MPSIPSMPFGSSARASRRITRERPRIPVPTARAIVDCGVYVQGRRLPGRFTHRDALAEVHNRGQGFVWIGLHDPDDRQMTDIAEAFGLHALAVEDAVMARQRPKLECYDDTLVLVMRTVAYVEHELHSISEIVETGEIMVFCAPGFVITVRHGEHSGLASVRKNLEADPAMLMRGPDAVLHAIADYVVDNYVDVAASVELDIEAMEEEVFTPRSQIAVESIYQLKREVVELRRAVNPLGIPLQLLAHKPELPLSTEIRRYMRDVADHHTGVAERITDFDGSLSALISAALAKVGVQQNTDMRKISAWVAIAAVPTMGAGIYGMNFEHMPELRWTYGYPLVMAIIATICVALFITFRRNHWL